MNSSIPTSGSLNDIQIPTGLTAPPQATESFNARISLSASCDSDFTTTVTIFDSPGRRHDLTIVLGPTDTECDGTDDARTYDMDITKELTGMIIHQRGYQANSQTITTTDEVIQEALSLKR